MNDCIEWTGSKNGKGYGVKGLTINGKKTSTPAHRWMYQEYVGKIPEGLEIDHLCRNRGCVNVKHLEPVTHKENLMRGNCPTAINARKTHCIHGHELMRYESNPKRRYCQTCLRKWNRKYYLKKKRHKL